MLRSLADARKSSGAGPTLLLVATLPSGGRGERRGRVLSLRIASLRDHRLSASLGGLSSALDSVENELQPESELVTERHACELVGCGESGGVGLGIEGEVEVAQLRRVVLLWGSRSVLL